MRRLLVPLIAGCVVLAACSSDQTVEEMADDTATTTAPTTAPAADSTTSDDDAPGGDVTPEPEVVVLTLTDLYDMVDALPSRGWVDGPRYDYDLYSPDRLRDLDSDGDCQSDRTEVLIADAEWYELDGSGCRVVDGEWIDPYTGERFSTDEDSIEHVVAVAEVHWAGGHAWSRERREAFAVDIGDPSTLNVARVEVNTDKGALPPQDFAPADDALACQYGIDRVRIMTRWSLAVWDDDGERNALYDLLDRCPDGTTAPVVEVMPDF